MKMNRIISTLLAVVMLLSAFVMTVGATDTAENTTEYTYNTSNAQPSMSYREGTTYVAPSKEGEKPGVGEPIDTPEKKLATMDLRLEKDGYQLYVDAYSGETAVKNIATGELLFSNPYDKCRRKGKYLYKRALAFAAGSKIHKHHNGFDRRIPQLRRDNSG